MLRFLFCSLNNCRYVGLYVCLVLYWPAASHAQTAISGTVIDSVSSLPISNVTVSVQGSPIATKTDENGRYSISAPPQAVLLFSSVGYKGQSIAVEGEAVIDVIMIATYEGLEEVVVLGFGQTQKKIAQTGSVASISSKELRQSPVANITNALAGRLPGLVTLQRGGEPGSDSPLLYIRGTATFNNSNPLVTIDGVQKDYESIRLLDPNEIENITILKDASATALYGVKGANGVIIVTTKRGELGVPKINVSVESAVQDLVRIPEFLDAYSNAVLANEAYRNDFPESTVPLYSDEALEAFRTGSDPLRYPNVDWLGELTKLGVQNKGNFNISGGSKLAKYFVNIGYVDQGGTYRATKNEEYDPNARFQRYNFRSNVDIDFNDDFAVGLSLFGAIEDKTRPRFTQADIFWTGISVPPDATAIKYPLGYYGVGKNGENNVFWLLNENGYVQEFNSSLSGMLSVSRKLNFITEGLTLKGNYSFDGYFNNNLSRTEASLRLQYKGAGDFDDIDSYNIIGEDIPLSAPSSSFRQNRDVWMDVSLNYQKTMGGHSISALLLANRTQKVLGNQVPFVSQGLVSRLVYDYRSRYFAEINAGYNGTDNFAKRRRYGFFPAVSAGWVLSNESFLANQRTVNHLKLRGSYGLTGNDQLGARRWLFISEYVAGGGYPYGSSLAWLPGIQEGAMANEDISWEMSRKANLGLEVQFFNNLVGLNVDVFKEHRYDILITRNSIPGIIGMPSNLLPPANMGKVDNKGFEVEVTHKHNLNWGSGVSYFLNGNASFSRNKIVFMDEPLQPYPWQQRTGLAIGQLYGLKNIGFFESVEDISNSPTHFGRVMPGDLKYADLNDDGVIDDTDLAPIGRSVVPEIFFGISGGLSYKGLDISFLLQGAGNSYRQIVGPGFYEFFQGGKTNSWHLGRWTPETAATATYPRLHYGGSLNNHRNSTFSMENTSYMRLKNVEIGYTFKDVSFFRTNGFDNLRVYATGMNLYTWSKVRQFDPENYNGYGAVYPPMRIFNFGLAVNF